MSSFGSELFTYITTLVPYWRVNDEAWPLDAESEPPYLSGIGVLRNYGGQVMVVPGEDSSLETLSSILERKPFDAPRVIVVVDDRDGQDWHNIAARVSPVRVLPWSRRDELRGFVIKDEP